MKPLQFIGLIFLLACSNAPKQDAFEIPKNFPVSPIALKKLYDSIASDTSPIEGFKPKSKLNFSHKIHAGNLGLDCLSCHKTGSPQKKVSLKQCKSCHSFSSEKWNELEYYQQIDSIAAHIDK